MAILAFVFAATWFVTGAMAAHFAQAIAPPARLMRRGETVPTVLPQPIGDHPTAQGLARHRTAVMLCQLLRRQARAKVGIPLPHDRQRESANLSG